MDQPSCKQPGHGLRFIGEPARWLGVLFEAVGALALFVMMALTCMEVFSRYVLNNPVAGATELTEILLAVVVLMALPTIALRGDHIVVDLTDPLFSPLAHKLRQSLIGVISAGALFYLGERVFALAARALRNGDTTEHLEIPAGYVIYFIGASCWLTATLAAAYALVVLRTGAETDPGPGQLPD